MDNLNERAASSKSQRRLFVMAYLYKNGKLGNDFASEEIKKLSELPEKTLKQFASTKQKKRKKDGSISKRDAIPEKVKK